MDILANFKTSLKKDFNNLDIDLINHLYREGLIGASTMKKYCIKSDFLEHQLSTGKSVNESINCISIKWDCLPRYVKSAIYSLQ